MILLVVNLFLGLVSLKIYGCIYDVFRNWGEAGSGTEGRAWYPTDFTRDINPIPCHSHNDYWRHVPLFDAIRAGFTGVEADVWLFDDNLYVGHNTASLTRNRTFQSLYIDPLVKILERQNPNTEFFNGTNHGVFDTNSGMSLTLLVDLKTEGAKTWPWVLAQLEPLRKRGWLSYVENDVLYPGPITVVGTGNTPFDVLTANATYRDAFFDAPLSEMWEPGTGEQATPPIVDSPAHDGEGIGHVSRTNIGQGLSGVSAASEFTFLNSYYASVSFPVAVGEMVNGELTPKQMAIIRGQIRGAHRRGLKARYWDLPVWPLRLRNHVWDVLVREGMDMLNVDDLKAASRLDW